MDSQIDKYLKLMELGVFSERNHVLYHVYNMSPGFEELQKEFRYRLYSSRLRLYGTGFEYVPFGDVDCGRGGRPLTWRVKKKGSGWVKCNIDYVLDNVPEEIQEVLIFNLDLFLQGGR